MEIELRACISDVDALVDQLDKKNVVHKSNSFQHDEYFKHTTDLTRDLVLRIRTEGGETGLLTFKAKDPSGSDNAWAEANATLGDVDGLRQILLDNKYEQVVDIKKHRQSFLYDDKYEVNIDQVEGLGSFVEIEGEGVEAERDAIEAELKQILLNLGVQEQDLVSKGYVALMLEESVN